MFNMKCFRSCFTYFLDFAVGFLCAALSFFLFSAKAFLQNSAFSSFIFSVCKVFMWVSSMNFTVSGDVINWLGSFPPLIPPHKLRWPLFTPPFPWPHPPEPVGCNHFRIVIRSFHPICHFGVSSKSVHKKESNKSNYA